MNRLIKAIEKGRMYNGYIICAHEISQAAACANEIADAVGTTPYIIEEPNMENIRRLQTGLYEDVQKGDAKVAIIYGDGMSDRCQNAMLKTIEEHPGDICIVFALTNMAALLPTIVSRCITYYPDTMDEKEILKAIGKENLLYARYALGSESKARELMSSKSFVKERDKAADIMERLKGGSVCVLQKDEKECIKEYLKYMFLFLRDVLTGDIFWFFDKRDSVISYINIFTTKDIISMIKIVQDANIKLYRNTNPMLVFDKVQLAVLEVINECSNRGKV